MVRETQRERENLKGGEEEMEREREGGRDSCCHGNKESPLAVLLAGAEMPLVTIATQSE